jgi:hypothetical protein
MSFFHQNATLGVSARDQVRLGRASWPRSISTATAEGYVEAAFLGVGFESPRDQVANPGVDGRAPDNRSSLPSTAVRWRRADRAAL